MLVSINNPIQATAIFAALGFLVLAFSCRPRKESEIFPLTLTQELKGFAILAIVLSHIGYFLVSDHRFLFPLSIFAGVGVDLFLFLSGFGLALSALRKKLSIGQFYNRRLLKLFIPLWVSIILFFIIDYFFLHLFYGWLTMAQTAIAYFPHADIYTDLNSPLWYLTLIVFYYLLFPLLFSKKYPWLSAIVLFIITRVIISLNPDFLSAVISLYKVHLVAFPLGILFAYVLNRRPSLDLAFLKGSIRYIVYYVALIAAIVVTGYTAIHSGVGKTPFLEESLSLVCMTAIVIIFILKKIESRFLLLCGLYSYEIYLLHWPILQRYDFLFSWLPPWLAVFCYLALFLLLGWGLQSLVGIIENRKAQVLSTK